MFSQKAREGRILCHASERSNEIQIQMTIGFVNMMWTEAALGQISLSGSWGRQLNWRRWKLTEVLTTCGNNIWEKYLVFSGRFLFVYFFKRMGGGIEMTWEGRKNNL